MAKKSNGHLRKGAATKPAARRRPDRTPRKRGHAEGTTSDVRNGTATQPVGGHPDRAPIAATAAPREDQDRKSSDADKEHPISRAVDSFLAAMQDYRDGAFVAIPLVLEKRQDELKQQFSAMSKFPSKKLPEGGMEFTPDGPHAASQLLATIRTIDMLSKSKIHEVMARSMFIGMFSEFDAFSGALLKALYSKRGELYRAIKREISLGDILNAGTVDELMQDILDREIDSFRRQSYPDQFAELERRFDIESLRKFDEWPVFVELGQRRNLLTHNDGQVSHQYLSVCEREGFQFNEKPAVKQRLTVDPEYLAKAMLILSKVAFMLAHTLWRKVLPDERESADNAFNDTLFTLLLRREWRQAAEFGEFGMSPQLCRKSNDLLRRIRIVNTAIALTNMKRTKEAIRILDGEDWSAAIREFRLANAVLRGEYKTAAQLMKEIGKRGEHLTQMSYHDWPLFNDFRDSEHFQSAYEDIYGLPFLQKLSEDAMVRSAQIKKDLARQGLPAQQPQKQTARATRGAKNRAHDLES